MIYQIRNDCDYNDFYIVSQEEANSFIVAGIPLVKKLPG